MAYGMDRELKKAQAALAHDLNNFLQVIMGNLELLKRRQQFVPELVDAALAATRNAGHFAERLHSLRRLEPQEPRVFDLNRLARELAEAAKHVMGDAIRVQTELAPDLPSAYADPRALQVAVLELADNARAAMPRGGQATLRTAAAPPGHLLVEFADTGSGMPPERVQHAFDPPASPAEGGKPGGVGLFIVEHCVREAGGRVELASTPGAGTTVKLYLPAKK
jgi:signal transduction histidine kinase